MSTDHITLADFEALYQANGDPWQYESSDYEKAKYDATLVACGPGPFESVLELGGSIGVFSAVLADRCRQLTTIDGAPTAVEAARRRLHDAENVRILLGEIPASIPNEPVDLVLASEILYYLDDRALKQTLKSLEAILTPSGRVVAVHWRPTGPERPFSAEEVHEQLGALEWLTEVKDQSTNDYLLQAFTRR